MSVLNGVSVMSFVHSYARADGDHGYPTSFWIVHLSCGHSTEHRGDGFTHLPLMLRCDKCESVASAAIRRGYVAPV